MTPEFYALTAHGPRPLPVAPGARGVHDLFDHLPLGVYSALRTFEHERFLGLEQHLDRTDRSMELLGWKERLDRARLTQALDACVRGFPGADAIVRFDVLSEPARALGVDERMLLALAPFVPVPEAFLEHGVRVCFSPLRRARPLIKVASFVVERRPYPLGSSEAFEHLIVDSEGHILEGSSSNFLALRGRELYLAGETALQGVTQRIVAELAGGLGLSVVREPVHTAELSGIDEAFLTGSTRGVVPVIAVEGERIGMGVPGPWTRRLLEAYREHAHRNARPALPRPAAARSTP